MAKTGNTMFDNVKTFLRRSPTLRAIGMRYGAPLAVGAAARRKGLKASFFGDLLEIRRGHDVIRMTRHHVIYVFDIIDNFEYYFSAVRPAQIGQKRLVDYSRPSFHEIIDHDDQPVFFPSFSEPYVTTEQYLDFAQLKPGQVAFDLGAYSGLSAMAFKKCVGETGVVVAVEADTRNLAAVERNFKLFTALTGMAVELLYGAVWRDNKGLTFSSEGNMGSSAMAIVGSGRGNKVEVPSFTLSDIAARFNLPTVDFIKADIEGGEAFIFGDAAFFAKYRPRIIIEPHMVDGEMSSDIIKRELEKYGYRCEEVFQYGSVLPLLQCYPEG